MHTIRPSSLATRLRGSAGTPGVRERGSVWDARGARFPSARAVPPPAARTAASRACRSGGAAPRPHRRSCGCRTRAAPRPAWRRTVGRKPVPRASRARTMRQPLRAARPAAPLHACVTAPTRRRACTHRRRRRGRRRRLVTHLRSAAPSASRHGAARGTSRAITSRAARGARADAAAAAVSVVLGAARATTRRRLRYTRTAAGKARRMRFHSRPPARRRGQPGTAHSRSNPSHALPPRSRRVLRRRASRAARSGACPRAAGRALAARPRRGGARRGGGPRPWRQRWWSAHAACLSTPTSRRP
jgi:hypothetical protein